MSMTIQLTIIIEQKRHVLSCKRSKTHKIPLFTGIWSRYLDIRLSARVHNAPGTSPPCVRVPINYVNVYNKLSSPVSTNYTGMRGTNKLCPSPIFFAF